MTPARKLPLFAVLRETLRLPWIHRGEVFRAAGAPLLAIIAFDLLWQLPFWGTGWPAEIALHLAQAVVVSWLAITLHRLVLLDEASASRHFTIRSWIRVAKYAAAFVAIWLSYMLAHALLLNGIGLASGISYVPTGGTRNEFAWFWLYWVTALVALLAVARFGLILPAIAVDRPLGLKAAWRLSRGNTLGLVVIFGVVPWAIAWATRSLLYEDSSSLSYALVTVLGCLLAIFEVVAMSLAFGALTAPAPPPTDPPS